MSVLIIPSFVRPGWRFNFDPHLDTVETHMLLKTASGVETWAITHQTTGTIFLSGEPEYRRCADEIRKHRARANIAGLPREQGPGRW